MTGRRGFTLLEVLVVLVITGLLSAVLMQAFSFVLAVRSSVTHKITGLDLAVVQRNLFLEPLRGLVPDYPEKANVFSGNAQKIHGLTTRAIENRIGAPVGFDLYFQYETADDQTTLIYREQGRTPIELGHWGGDRGIFSYRGPTGDWQPAWPPQQTAADAASGVMPPQTPSVVRIETGTGFPATLVASILGPHDRLLRLRDGPMAGDIRVSQ